MTARVLSPAERDAFVTSLEQEFGWAEVTSGWSRHTTAEARAADREQWLIDVVMRLTTFKSDAMNARNVLASALDLIDGEHSSSLVDCATRAAELLNMLVADPFRED